MIKMNKKGFTLIEMLVVIAIIAILVAIIIPAVSSSTDRAAAAADAANLRSAKAVIAVGQLEGKYDESTTFDAGMCGVPAEGKYKAGTDSAANGFFADIETGGKIVVKYGTRDIETLAGIAGNKK